MLSRYQLQHTHSGLELHAPSEKKFKPLRVEFSDYARDFRANEGDLLKRAVGKISSGGGILDATMGFARDGFRLARYGYQVWSVEENQIVFALVEDALKRARLGEPNALINWTILNRTAESLDPAFFLENKIQVLYLDPMFPEKKTASSKDLQILQDLSPATTEKVESLVEWAFMQPVKKVVIKRPIKATPLFDRPSHVLSGRSIRWDVYVRP